MYEARIDYKTVHSRHQRQVSPVIHTVLSEPIMQRFSRQAPLIIPSHWAAMTLHFLPFSRGIRMFFFFFFYILRITQALPLALLNNRFARLVSRLQRICKPTATIVLTQLRLWQLAEWTSLNCASAWNWLQHWGDLEASAASWLPPQVITSSRPLCYTSEWGHRRSAFYV